MLGLDKNDNKGLHAFFERCIHMHIYSLNIQNAVYGAQSNQEPRHSDFEGGI